jgi:predicted CoA-binding protein
MKEIIKAFLDSRDIAIAGASPSEKNWGKYLMKELSGSGYNIYPVNPKYKEIEGTPCYASVSDLPDHVESLILAVNPELALEIAVQCSGSHVKRAWLHQGAGKGAYTEKAHKQLSDSGIDVVYGFCPMMFFGKGMHKFHFWFRRTFGKVPVEFSMN